jgi:hypothetical protein
MSPLTSSFGSVAFRRKPRTCYVGEGEGVAVAICCGWRLASGAFAVLVLACAATPINAEANRSDPARKSVLPCLNFFTIRTSLTRCCERDVSPRYRIDAQPVPSGTRAKRTCAIGALEKCIGPHRFVCENSFALTRTLLSECAPASRLGCSGSRPFEIVSRRLGCRRSR